VRFRHPLARSVTYWSAPLPERQEAHRALAEATDSALDPDRRSWHLAEAAPGPDETVADELERSAGRAQARGGLAAAAAFLGRAAALTLDPPRRAGRALAAAVTHLQAGAFDAAVELLEVAEAGPLTELDRARVDLVRAQLAFVLSRGGEAPLLLVKAAERLEAIDPALARETYLDAFAASTFAGRAASRGGGVLDVARAAASAPAPVQPQATDLLLAGLAANFNDGYAAGVPDLRHALAAFGDGMPPDRELRWLWLMSLAALHTWDDEQWVSLSSRYVELARSSGALSEMPLALSTRAMMLLLADAAPRVEEQQAVTEATGGQLAPYSAMFLAAMRGQVSQAHDLIAATTRQGPARGEGISVAVAEWTRAVLNNGLGDYSEAMAAAQRALHHQEYPQLRYPGVANWAAAELVEAAAHSGATDVAAEATRWITAMTTASGTNWARGVEARSRALLAAGPAAEDHFRESISYLQQTHVGAELARAQLLYGEWLRRERRRSDAREQLRSAHQAFEAMGMEAFAERARHELAATGETARKRTVSSAPELTAQEALIARMASDGLSNPEIASRLFISSRTVQYHLRKVFAKLGINSRSQLGGFLAQTT
jgi:DNA-binding CsgD family transcriptional regulator